MGAGYNQNRRDNGQFSTGPQSPANAANARLTEADVTALQNQAAQEFREARGEADSVLDRIQREYGAGRISFEQYVAANTEWTNTVFEAYQTALTNAVAAGAELRAERASAVVVEEEYGDGDDPADYEWEEAWLEDYDDDDDTDSERYHRSLTSSGPQGATGYILPTDKKVNPRGVLGNDYYTPGGQQVLYVVQGPSGGLKAFTSYGEIEGWEVGGTARVIADQTGRDMGLYRILGVVNEQGLPLGFAPNKQLPHGVFK